MVVATLRACGLAFLLGGCSALVDPDVDSLGVEPLACRPLEIRACPCSSDVLGMQQCNAGGSYDACICPPIAGSGANGQGRR